MLQATAQAPPHADQVADRWHLMENASRAFLDAVRKSMRQVRVAIGIATVNPKLLTAAERLPYEGYLRREKANAVIRGFVSEGVSIKLRLAGFGGGLRAVTEWATRRRRDEKAESGLGYAPAARTIVRLMTLERNNLTKAQTMTVAAIEERLPTLVEAKDVVENFHEMLRRKSKDDLKAWMTAAKSLVAPRSRAQ